MALYSRTVPGDPESRRELYTKLAVLVTHLQSLNTDLVRIEITPSAVEPGAIVLDVELSNPVDDPANRKHVGLENE